MRRNYRKEYDNYHSKPKQKKRRAQRNAARDVMAVSYTHLTLPTKA